MAKTDKKILEEIIRVDHAGERGAIKIYEGQLLALNTFVKAIRSPRGDQTGVPYKPLPKVILLTLEPSLLIT